MCGFDETISCRTAFVPKRMKRNRRGTRWTTCRSVSTLSTRQSAESPRIRPSTVTHGSRQRNERTMAATNRRLYPAVVTVMLFTPPDVADISSSTVREVLAFGRSVAEFLPRGIELENYL